MNNLSQTQLLLLIVTKIKQSAIVLHTLLHICDHLWLFDLQFYQLDSQDHLNAIGIADLLDYLT